MRINPRAGETRLRDFPVHNYESSVLGDYNDGLETVGTVVIKCGHPSPALVTIRSALSFRSTHFKGSVASRSLLLEETHCLLRL